MKTNNLTARCLAFTVPGIPTAGDAAKLLRRELTARGAPLWPAAEIEVFPGSRESLLLARPATDTRIYISSGAVAVLSAYFDRESY